MDWQRKTKRSAPPAPLRRASRARSSGKVVHIAFSEDEEDFGGGPPVRVHSTLVKLTCAPDVATSETTTTAPAIVAPAAAEQCGGVPIFLPSDPLARYVPLSVRRIPSDEDWLMEGLKPAEE